MKNYILKKRIFAVVFLIVIFSFSVINFIHSYEPLKVLLTDSEREEAVTVAELETSINENLYGRMMFIETYGFVQLLLDKKENNNFSNIVDEAGFLHYASFYREDDSCIFEYAMRLKRLQDCVKPNNTKVLFVVPPGKYCSDITTFREGLLVNDPNPMVDELLFYLNRLGVETLDLRESIPNETLSYEEVFYKTDHHWTIPAAFQATGEVVEKIEESFGEDLDPEDYYTDIRNYDVVTYKRRMLGSMGRKTGAVFSGLDDFTAIWPHYQGNFSRNSLIGDSLREEDLEGNFVEALIDLELLLEQDDVYSETQYSMYLHGINIYEHIINNEKPDGPSFLMIRDSYFSPVITFMMPMCGQIDAIWSLEETEEINIETYVKEKKFDYIIIEIYPYNIEDRAFNFFKED